MQRELDEFHARSDLGGIVAVQPPTNNGNPRDLLPERRKGRWLIGRPEEVVVDLVEEEEGEPEVAGGMRTTKRRVSPCRATRDVRQPPRGGRTGIWHARRRQHAPKERRQPREEERRK